MERTCSYNVPDIRGILEELDEPESQEMSDLSHQLISENDLKKIMESHYKERKKALYSLNHLMSVDWKQMNNDGYFYPNLDFISDYGSYFKIDNKVLCNVGSQNNPIRLIKDFGKGKIGEAKLIDFKGANYVMKSISNVKHQDYLSLRVIELDMSSPVLSCYGRSDCVNQLSMRPSLIYNAHKITEVYDKNMVETDSKNKVNPLDSTEIRRGSKGVSPLKYGFFVAIANNFSNQTCMHLILNEILGDCPNYVYQYDAFYCRGEKGQLNGYNIMDVADQGDLSSFLEKTEISGSMLLDILRQVLTPLSILKCQKFGFVHADLKCRNVFVKMDGGRPIYKIADFDKSSIFWNGIRFMTTPFEALEKINHGFPLKPVSSRLKEYYYQIPSGVIPPEAFIMHGLIPMHMSHDVYTFIYSLMREPKVCEYIEKTESGQDNDLSKFLSIYSLLWQDETDLDKISTSIAELYDRHQNNLEKVNNASHDKSRQKALNQLNKDLKEHRSISNINADLSRLKIKLKYNIDEIYSRLGLMTPSQIDSQIDLYEPPKEHIYHITKLNSIGKESHICVSPCLKNGNVTKCQTNKYHFLKKEKTEDQCFLPPTIVKK